MNIVNIALCPDYTAAAAVIVAAAVAPGAIHQQ